MAKSNYSAVPSASLAKALSAVVRASGKDPYQMVHVQSENGKLSVRCFNGLMGILAIIAAEDKGNAFDAMIDAQAFGQQPVLRGDHVVVAVFRKAGTQLVTRFGRPAVSNIVGKHEVILRCIERLARAVQLAGKFRPQKLRA